MAREARRSASSRRALVGGWNIDEVTPSDLPEGSYELTFGDRNEKNRGGISKRGEAHLRGGTWTVEDVMDA
jgi:hypothetical protein